MVFIIKNRFFIPKSRKPIFHFIINHFLSFGKYRKWKLPPCEKENSIKSLPVELPSSLWSRRSKSRNCFSLVKLTRWSKEIRIRRVNPDRTCPRTSRREGSFPLLLTVTIIIDFRCCQETRFPSQAVHLQALQQTIRLQQGPNEAPDVRLWQIAALQVSVLRPAGQISLDYLQSCASDTSRNARYVSRSRRWYPFSVNQKKSRLQTFEFVKR